MDRSPSTRRWAAAMPRGGGAAGDGDAGEGRHCASRSGSGPSRFGRSPTSPTIEPFRRGSTSAVTSDRPLWSASTTLRSHLRLAELPARAAGRTRARNPPQDVRVRARSRRNACHRLDRGSRWALGSYSYVPVGAGVDDMRRLAEPVSGRLLLAGEATVRGVLRDGARRVWLGTQGGRSRTGRPARAAHARCRRAALGRLGCVRIPLLLCVTSTAQLATPRAIAGDEKQ